jgi:hypothetical protein
MEKITLYTGREGFSLFEIGEKFCASDVKLSDSDLEFTVNKEDVVFLHRSVNDDCDLYDVVNLDSVEWVDEKSDNMI